MMSRYWAIISKGVKHFHPSYFAMVMATGIVSIAFEEMAFPAIARTLFVLNLVFYLVLCIVLVARIAFFRQDLVADLLTLRRTWLFLTFVVGTNTIGTQLLIFEQAATLATFLWLIALAAWVACIYSIIFNFASQPSKPLHEIVNGATLLVVVSTVSVALLAIRLLDIAATPPGYIYFAAAAFWILGFILYLFILPLVSYCLFCRHLALEDWDSPYWICMGAPAIITLAGAELVTHLPLLPSWEGTRDTVLWLTMFSWVVGTLWIPYQLIMDIRKFTHTGITGSTPVWVKTFPWCRLAFGRQHHVYDPPSWSRVFPMGMYAACTLSLAKAAGLQSLAVIPQYWAWFALLVWALTSIGAFRSIIHSFSSG
jgi:tellurite resistance protein TehA-like permease